MTRRPPVEITLLLALSLLLPWPVVLHAAAVVVQKKVEQACGTTPCTVDFDMNVTGGNAVICGVATVNGSSTTYACSDATNGTYSDTVRKISSGTARTAEIDEKRSVTGGFTQVTITPNAGTAAIIVYLYEVSGLGAGAASTGSNEDTTQTTHNASSAGLTATGFALALGIDNNGAGTVAGGSGWTLDSTGDFYIAQSKAAAFSGDQCAYTSASSSNIGACAIFPESGGAPPASGCRGALTLLGAGGC